MTFNNSVDEIDRTRANPWTCIKPLRDYYKKHFEAFVFIVNNKKGTWITLSNLICSKYGDVRIARLQKDWITNHNIIFSSCLYFIFRCSVGYLRESCRSLYSVQ